MTSIEDPELIERIPAHVEKRAEEPVVRSSLGACAPPQPSLL